jgi:hypothetical protein
MMTFKELKKRVQRGEAESGQAIVLVALFMVVLIGMLGLAIDGGGMFLLWRDAQNAADTSVLKSAFTRCTSANATSNSWIQAGIDEAAQNGFPASDPNATVTVQTWANDSNFVEVIIEADKPAYFIQFVYQGPLTVRARALAFCQRAFDPSTIGGMVGLMDCSTCANSTEHVTLSGSNAYFDGPIRSNCGVEITVNSSPGSTSGITGDVNSVGDTDLQGNIPVGGDIDANNPDNAIDEDFLNSPITLYAPPATYSYPGSTGGSGGEIWNLVAIKYAVDTDSDGFYPVNDSTPDTGSFDLSNMPGGVVQGLIYVDGHIDNDTSNWGAVGATLVATGRIDFGNNQDDQYRFYGHDPSGTGDSGVAVRTTNGDVFPSFLAYSLHNQLEPTLQCNNMISQGNSAISSNGNDTVLFGVLYAPFGGIDWSGSSVDGQGALIGQKVDFAGANSTYTFDPSMLPPRAPRINMVE